MAWWKSKGKTFDYAAAEGESRTFSGMDYVRSLAASIDSKLGVKVVTSKGRHHIEVTHVDMDTQTVYLRDEDAYLYGDDFVVGMLLHEIGHLRHTPHPIKHESARHKDLFNMLEDARMEELMRGDYDGARYFLGEMNDEVILKLRKNVAQPLKYKSTTDAGVKAEIVATAQEQIINTVIDTERMLRAHGLSKDTIRMMLSGDAKENAERLAIEEYKMRGWFTILSHAAVRAAGYKTVLPVVEWDDASHQIAAMRQESVTASSAELAKLVTLAYSVMQRWAYDEKNDSDGGGGALNPMQAAEMAGTAGGHESSPSSGEAKPGDYEAKRWPMYDANAKNRVDKLKRVLIAKLRENKKAKHERGKRRGTLNKRAIARIARDNYRIYQKRTLPKGKEYAASVILDTSGSMWRGGGWHEASLTVPTKINTAIESTAMLIRTLRAMSIPTSLTIYGEREKEIVAHGDMYIPERIGSELAALTDRHYISGDNQTYRAIGAQIPKLRKVAGRRDSLMIVITDGGLTYDDLVESKRLLTKEMRKGNFHPVLFYVEDGTSRILGDAKREKYIEKPESLIVECEKVLREIANPTAI